MSSDYTLKWNGDQVLKVSEDQLIEIVSELGGTTEAESKKELRKGHGVLTGTLRRSIHAADPNYPFASDNVAASSSSPERGGKMVKAIKIAARQFGISVGSGLKYAMRIHQGWGKFKGYHYLVNGLDKAKAKVPEIIGRHQV